MKALIDKDTIAEWQGASTTSTSNAGHYAIALAIVELTREAKRIANNLDTIANQIEGVEVTLSERS